MAQAGYTPIQLYYSTTASAAPSSGNLANGELAINITDGKLYYKDNGGTVQVLAGKGGTGVVAGSNTQIQFNNNGVFGASSGLTFDGTTLTVNALAVTNGVTLSGGTANGVVYLNGSKVVTTGSALTFDGSLLKLGTGAALSVQGVAFPASGSGAEIFWDGSESIVQSYNRTSSAYVPLWLESSYTRFGINGSEQMRLTSTGLGIGTSSPAAKLNVNGNALFNGTTKVTSSAVEIQGDMTLGNYAAYSTSNYRDILYSASTASFGNQPTANIRFQTTSDIGAAITFLTRSSAGDYAERMRLDQVGNLGIGTSSPGYKLDVNGATQITSASGTNLRLYTASGAPLIQFYPNAAGGRAQTIYSTDSSSGLGGGLFVIEDTASSNRLVFAGASGNLGLGVTPSAWSGYRAIQMGYGASFATPTGGLTAQVLQNGYYNGTNWIYLNTGLGATRYEQGGSSHIWFNAPSGTAGAAISFTQAMTLDASGNLLVGATSVLNGAGGRGNITVNGSSSAIIAMGVGGVEKGYIYTQGTDMIANADTGSFTVQTASAQPVIFQTTGTERARIDSSGNLLVGTTSSGGARLQVNRQNSSKDQPVFTWTNATNNTGYLSIFSSAVSGENGAGISADDALFFGRMISGAFTERARIDSGGNLLVGTTSAGTDKVRFASAQASANGLGIVSTDDLNGGGYISFRNSAAIEIGAIKRNGTSAVSYNTSSDYRLKENIQPMTGALAKVALLKPCTYNWKADGSEGEGFIAHELAEVVPQCVTGEKDAVDAEGKPVYQGIDTSFLVATLAAAIQELKAEFDAYKATHP